MCKQFESMAVIAASKTTVAAQIHFVLLIFFCPSAKFRVYKPAKMLFPDPLPEICIKAPANFSHNSPDPCKNKTKLENVANASSHARPFSL